MPTPIVPMTNTKIDFEVLIEALTLLFNDTIYVNDF